MFSLSFYFLGEERLQYFGRRNELQILKYKNNSEQRFDSLMKPLILVRIEKKELPADSLKSFFSRERNYLLNEFDIQNKIEAVESRYDWFMLFYWACMTIGGLVAIYSGIAWFNKLQSVQDTILLMELELKRIELKEAKSPSRYYKPPYTKSIQKKYNRT